MRLYTCQHCEAGNHDKCEGGYGTAGYYGGGRCSCRCHGPKINKANMKPVSVTRHTEGTKKYMVKLVVGNEERYLQHDDLKSAIESFEKEPTAVKVYSQEVVCVKEIYAERTQL